MVESLLLLLSCQMAGEALTRGLLVPVPGPVVGMAILFVVLLWRGRNTAEVKDDLPGKLGPVADALLQNLSLLFVPAAVGIVQHFGRVRDHALPIAAAIILSTLATFVVTALVFRAMQRLTAKFSQGGE